MSSRSGIGGRALRVMAAAVGTVCLMAASPAAASGTNISDTNQTGSASGSNNGLTPEATAAHTTPWQRWACR